jgi:hypothetical protein
MGGQTNFPTALDDDSSLFDVTDGVSTLIEGHHNNTKEAVKALEAKVGIRSTSVATSLDYRLGHPTGSHRHDGASGQGQPINATTITGLTAVFGGAKHRSHATQFLPNAAWTPLFFEIVDWDDHSYRGATAATAVVPANSRLDVLAMSEFTASPSGSRFIRILRNGGIVAIEGNRATDAANHRIHTGTEIVATAGDTLVGEVYQSSGATLAAIPATGYSPQFVIRRTG